MKVFVASFNRASNGALSKLIRRLKEEQLWTDNYHEADYILAPGDRIETLHFVIDRYSEGKRIIHLWAGEISQGTHDELWRQFITEMSSIQLCTNEEAKQNLPDQRNAYVIGNIMFDNMEHGTNKIPLEPYDVILYNPPTLLSREDIKQEINNITKKLDGTLYYWIEPNWDYKSDLIQPYVNTKTMQHGDFLDLLRHCRRFITNSSCMYYEAPFLRPGPQDIIPVGIRNYDRGSKHAKMDMPDATEKVISLLKKL